MILSRIEDSLRDAGSGWDRVARISFYLQRSQAIDQLRRLFADRVEASIPETEVVYVDGYSSVGKLCEIEVTAVVGRGERHPPFAPSEPGERAAVPGRSMSTDNRLRVGQIRG